MVSNHCFEKIEKAIELLKIINSLKDTNKDKAKKLVESNLELFNNANKCLEEILKQF